MTAYVVTCPKCGFKIIGPRSEVHNAVCPACKVKVAKP